MLRLIGVELFKLKKRWLVYGLLIAMLIFTILPIITTYFSYQSVLKENPDSTAITVTQTTSEGEGGVVIIDGHMGTSAETLKESFTLPGSMNGLLSSIANMGPFLVIILVASAIGSEYRWGTLRQMLIKGTGRSQYLGSKFIGIGIFVLAGIIIALLAGFITSIITSLAAGVGISWDFMSADFIGYLFASLVRVLLIIGVYFVLAALFSTWLRSVTAGMALGIVFIFADNIIYSLLRSSTTTWLADISQYTITYNTNELMRFSMSAPQDTSYWVQPTAILLVYCLVFLVAGFYVFRRQDISA